MAQSAMLKAYNNQVARCRNKLDAAGKPVEMRLSFDEWSKIWIDSGRWNERGNRSGQYCMSRVGDMGHYELGNVFIQLHAKNSSETSHAGHPASMGFAGKTHGAKTKILMSAEQLGSKNPRAILDEEKVRAIKTLLAAGEDHQRLADRFVVTKSTISAIATGRNWKHVTV